LEFVKKGMVTTLEEGDTFGFVPDADWFRVSLKNKVSTNNDNSNQVLRANNMDMDDMLCPTQPIPLQTPPRPQISRRTASPTTPLPLACLLASRSPLDQSPPTPDDVQGSSDNIPIYHSSPSQRESVRKSILTEDTSTVTNEGQPPSPTMLEPEPDDEPPEKKSILSEDTTAVTNEGQPPSPTMLEPDADDVGEPPAKRQNTGNVTGTEPDLAVPEPAALTEVVTVKPEPPDNEPGSSTPASVNNNSCLLLIILCLYYALQFFFDRSLKSYLTSWAKIQHDQ